MGNQQPSTLEERIFALIKNTKFGDGYFWRHPECKNYKMIHNSIDRELLKFKLSLVPEIFSSGIREKKRYGGHFDNPKPIYEIATVSKDIITAYATVDKAEMFNYLTLYDFALWYLDDGGYVMRKETIKGRLYLYPRYYLCIGDCCSTEEREEKFKSMLVDLFGDKWGNIRLNNSKASEKNKTWYIPKPIALKILDVAKTFNVMQRKFPDGEGSTTIPQGSRGTGLSSPKRTPTKRKIVNKRKLSR